MVLATIRIKACLLYKVLVEIVLKNHGPVGERFFHGTVDTHGYQEPMNIPHSLPTKESCGIA